MKSIKYYSNNDNILRRQYMHEDNYAIQISEAKNIQL